VSKHIINAEDDEFRITYFGPGRARVHVVGGYFVLIFEDFFVLINAPQVKLQTEVHLVLSTI
jgi:hypothetical protein